MKKDKLKVHSASKNKKRSQKMSLKTKKDVDAYIKLYEASPYGYAILPSLYRVRAMIKK